MILYLVIISVCWLVFAAVQSALLPAFGFFQALGLNAAATLAVIVLDGATAAVSRGLPEKWVPASAKIYAVGAKEKKFYEKLKIRKWKDRIPEIGHFTGFRKNKIADPQSPEYIERFLLESRYGEVGHLLSCPIGFLILLPLPFLPSPWWAFSLPVAIVNVILNLPSLFVLRYNSYKLTVLLKSVRKKQSREN